MTYSSKSELIESVFSNEVCIWSFSSKRLLPPRNSLEIRCERNSPEFALVRSSTDTNKYKILWKSARLNIRRVRLRKPQLEKIQRQLTSGKHVHLPYYRTDARCFMIPRGSTQWKPPNVFNGVLPKRVLFVVLSPFSIGSGMWQNNPNIFPSSAYGVSYIQFFVDEKAVLATPYEPNWSQKQYLHSYHGLLKTVGVDSSLVASGLNYDMYAEDYGIFGAQLEGVTESGTGSLSVEVKFVSDLKANIIGMLIPEYHSCVTIDGNRNVSECDY